MDMLPTAEYVVTCRTEGCSEIGDGKYAFATVGAEYVFCGVCLEQITDCVPVDPHL